MTTPTPPDPLDDAELDPSERIIARLDRLIAGVDVGASAVRKERRWRRFSFTLLVLGIVFGIAIGAWYWRTEHNDRLRAEHNTCLDRRERSADNQAAAAAVAEFEARFYGRPPAEAKRLGAGAAAILAKALPPPTC